jgi:hypothetical protein
VRGRMVGRREGGKVSVQPREMRRSAEPEEEVAALEPCCERERTRAERVRRGDREMDEREKRASGKGSARRVSVKN